MYKTVVAVHQGLATFSRDVGHGLLEVSHNGLAFLGLGVLALVGFMSGHQDLRQHAEQTALNWLQDRQAQRNVASDDSGGSVLASFVEPSAIARATATDPRELTRQQAAIAHWLARRYKVAPEPIARLVKEAWIVGERAKLDPTLILGIMAVESSFNPFAQSPVGAQGLMQVMTHIHDDKYELFGGQRAAFDPVTNLRVGVQVLQECIARAGSVEQGLKYYVGAANLPHDDGYASKVMGEARNLRLVASGRQLPVTVPQTESIVLVRSPATAVDAAVVAPTSGPASLQPASVPPTEEQQPSSVPTDKVARAS